METNKINITSSFLEKGFEVAKDFLDKLIMPAIEETGLLIKDQVTLWKFKNQIKMLNKAKDFCEKHKISPKKISLKLLCPLLDYAGLEEDDLLQDKWSILLSNLIDSDQNIQNHVFPYILSQISSNEFLVLEKVFDEKLERIKNKSQELKEFQEERPKLEIELKAKIDAIKVKVQEFKFVSHQDFNEKWNLQKELYQYESQLNSFKIRERQISFQIQRPAVIPVARLKEFELSNVIRLGLVKEEREFYAQSQTLEIPRHNEDDNYINVDIDIDMDSERDNILTELGELFVSACQEKIQVA